MLRIALDYWRLERRLWNAEHRLQRNLVLYTHAAGQAVLDSWQTITRTWWRAPTWSVTTTYGADSVVWRWSSSDPVLNIMEHGAPPHAIVPVRARYLVFPWRGRGRSYQAKTVPGRIYSRKGGARGRLHSFRAVWHPGIKARAWVPVIARLTRERALKVYGRFVRSLF